MSNIQVDVTGASGASVTVGGNTGNDIDITQGGVVDVSAGAVGTGSIASLALVAGTGISIATTNGAFVVSATGTQLDDFVTGTPATDQTIKWNGTDWVPTDFPASTTITSLDDVPDVDLTTTAPAVGQILSWDGTNWVPANDQTSTGSGGGATNITDLTDVSSEVPVSGHSLVWSGSLWQPKDVLRNDTAAVTVTPANGELVVKGGVSESGSITLNCEINTHGVTIQGPPHAAGATYTLTLPNTTGTSGQVLSTDGTGKLNWVEQSTSTGGTGGATKLNELSDVSGNPVDGQVLTYAGAGWVPSTPSQQSITWSTAPDNSTDAGSAGDLAYDDNFLYLHNGTQWVRATMSAFGASVAPVITVTQNPVSETISAGSSITFEADATVDNSATPTVQWQSSTDSGQTWSDVSGETSKTITLTSVAQTADGDQYRAVFSSTDAVDAVTSVSTVSVVTTTVDLALAGGWWTPLGWDDNAPSGAFLGLTSGGVNYSPTTTVWPVLTSAAQLALSAPSSFRANVPTQGGQSLSSTWLNSGSSDCYIELDVQTPGNEGHGNWGYELDFTYRATKAGVTDNGHIIGSGTYPTVTNPDTHSGGSGNTAVSLIFRGDSVGGGQENILIEAPNIAYNMIRYGNLSISYFTGCRGFSLNWSRPYVEDTGGVVNYTIQSRVMRTSLPTPATTWGSWATDFVTPDSANGFTVTDSNCGSTLTLNHLDSYQFRIAANYASSTSAWTYDPNTYVYNAITYTNGASNIRSRGGHCAGW